MTIGQKTVTLTQFERINHQAKFRSGAFHAIIKTQD